MELCAANVARANSSSYRASSPSSSWQQERSSAGKWLILSLLLRNPPRAVCVLVHGCVFAGNKCLVRVPYGQLADLQLLLDFLG